MDLATRIRMDLADGKPPEQIVTELVASGMSKPTAERLVDRALTTPAPAPPAPMPHHEGTDDPGGKWALVRGAFFFSIGVTITAVTYFLAEPGEEYTMAYGAVIVGVFLFGQGFYRWAAAEHHSFPAMLVLAALGLPMLGGAGLYWYQRENTPEARLTRALAQAEAANAAKLQQKLKQDEADKNAKIQKSLADDRDAVAAGQDMLDANPQVRCRAAHYFRDSKNPAGYSALSQTLEIDPDMSVRRCAIDGLVAIGTTKSLLMKLNQLAEYFPELVAYGLDKIMENPNTGKPDGVDPNGADRALIDRVRAKMDKR